MKKITPSTHNWFFAISLFCFIAVLTVTNSYAQQLDDDFTSTSTMSNWHNITTEEGWNAEQLQSYDFNTTQAGQFVMKPYTSVWFQDWRGPFIFQNITGDFVLTSSVVISGVVGTNPLSHYSLGGFMVRVPRTIAGVVGGAPFTNGVSGWAAGHENYISYMAGYGDPGGPCSPGAGTHMMVSNTTNSSTNMCLTSIPSTTIQIRVARIADMIIFLTKMPGGSWTVFNKVHRMDFPSTLQVGFSCMTDWDKATTYTPIFANSHVLNSVLSPDPSSNILLPFHPDIDLAFDYAKWNAPNVPTNLQGVDLVNNATDAQILSFLSFDISTPPPPPPPPPVTSGIGNVSIDKNQFYLVNNSNQISIVSKNNSTATTGTIYNALGQQQMKFNITQTSTTLDCNTLPTGIYIVRVNNTSLKFVKE